MQEDIREEFYSGFCRTCNGMQTVTCEYVREGEAWRLDTMNCAYAKCLHHAACEIYKEAFRYERD